MDMLGVPSNILEEHGAVSSQCATAMAKGATNHSLADISVSVTGIAGPDGGSAEKPVGLVYFGVASKSAGTKTYECHFEGSRAEVRQQSVTFALEALIDYAGDYS